MRVEQLSRATATRRRPDKQTPTKPAPKKPAQTKPTQTKSAPKRRTPSIQASLRRILKASYADALTVVGNTREIAGRPRQIQIGAMLAVCLAMLIALLGVQHPDRSLGVASHAFGIALPFLTMDLLVASQDFRPGRGTFPVNVLKFAAFRVCEGLGGLCMAIGIGAVLWHLGETVLIMTLIAAGLTILTPAAIVGVVFVWLFVLNARALRTGVDVNVVDAMRKSRIMSVFAPTTTESPEPSATEQVDIQQ